MQISRKRKMFKLMDHDSDNGNVWPKFDTSILQPTQNEMVVNNKIIKWNHWYSLLIFAFILLIDWWWCRLWRCSRTTTAEASNVCAGNNWKLSSFSVWAQIFVNVVLDAFVMWTNDGFAHHQVIHYRKLIITIFSNLECLSRTRNRRRTPAKKKSIIYEFWCAHVYRQEIRPFVDAISR